jgi:predicted acyl esterase
VIVTTFPRTVRVIEHTLIPLKDGTMLAARIWLPDDAEQNPVPAILEYLPYRKRDGTYERDALSHPYLAGHGYAGFAYCDFTRRDITLPIVRSSALQ